MNTYSSEYIYKHYHTCGIPTPDNLPTDKVHFLCGPKTFAAGHNDAIQIIKKAMFYSNRSFFVTPYEVKRVELTSPHLESLSGEFPSEYYVDMDWGFTGQEPSYSGLLGSVEVVGQRAFAYFAADGNLAVGKKGNISKSCAKVRKFR
jgi:hypothetical protein